MIEATACGTPVIAFNCGSVPEIVDHGVTGFAVRSPEAALIAMTRIDERNRRRVRATFERRFSSHLMARAYDATYRNLLRGAVPDNTQESSRERR